MEHFYCISYFEGDVSWVKEIDSPYIIYNKSGVELEGYGNVINIPNVGYNISSYLRFIIDYYNDLPESVVFCKNNVFPRHVSREVFNNICLKPGFSPIHDASLWQNMSFPVSGICNSGNFLEINNSWYCSKYDRKFFSSYNEFYGFVFGSEIYPMYLCFSPGANFVVPKENILLRSKSFYINLLTFVEHSQFSCESHFVERSLIAIWSSNQAVGNYMNRAISDSKFQDLAGKCRDQVARERHIIFKVSSRMFSFCCSLISRLFFIKR